MDFCVFREYRGNIQICFAQTAVIVRDRRIKVFDEMRVFVQCAECGSFTRAGKALGFSPSSVSRQVDKLESRLATKFFQRSTRHLVLTDAGQQFLQGARKVLSDVDDVFALVQAPHQEAEGSLKISVFGKTGGQIPVFANI